MIGPDLRQRREFLHGVGPFADCSKGELRKVEPLTSLHEAERGAALTEQGAVGREFFVIVDGAAAVWRNGVVIDELSSGSFFGELALLGRGDRTATVVADTDMTLVVLSEWEFRTLPTVAPSVVTRMVVELGTRLRRAIELAGTATLPAGHRASLQAFCRSGQATPG